MKKILTLAFLLIGLIGYCQPELTFNIPIRGLEKAAGPGYIPRTGAGGVQDYDIYTYINPIPLISDPPASGNTSNLSSFVTGPTGNVFYIDWTGDRIQLSGDAPAAPTPIVFDNRDTIRQVGHGFTLTTALPFIPIHQEASGWVAANTDIDLPATNLIEVINADSFVTMVAGPLWSTPHTLTLRNWLYLQDDGTYNSTTPDSDDAAGGGTDYAIAVAFCPDANTIWLYDPIASIIAAAGGGNTYTASQAIQLVGSDFRLGGPSIAQRVPITGSRVIGMSAIADYLEIYNEIIGSDVNSLRFRSTNGEGFFNNIQWSNTNSAVTSHLGMSASGNLRTRIEGPGTTSTVINGATVTVSSETAHQIQVPIVMKEYDPDAGVGLVGSANGVLVLSDGTIGRKGQLLFKDEDENYIPISEKIFSEVILVNAAISVGPSDWVWTCPEIYEGYRPVGVMNTFATAGDTDVVLSIDVAGTTIPFYNVTMLAGTTTTSIYPATTVILTEGNTIEPNVVSIAAPGLSPPTDWTFSFILAR